VNLILSFITRKKENRRTSNKINTNEIGNVDNYLKKKETRERNLCLLCFDLYTYFTVKRNQLKRSSSSEDAVFGRITFDGVVEPLIIVEPGGGGG
jgi:5-hydroxyisourate hydrolase-like protein (transthyretin family)